MAPSLHDREAERLAALHQLDILDTGPEEAFDALVNAASLACGTPIALISLVDAHRQWFKANTGLPGVTGTARAVSFCAHAIATPELMEIPDATLDARFAANDLVTGDPNIRFYAGMPLCLEDGHRIGTICVIDRTPRHLDATQRDILRSLARAATYIIETGPAVQQQQQTTRGQRQSEAVLDQTGGMAGIGGWSLDIESGKLLWTAETYRIHGVNLDYRPALDTAIAFYPPEVQPVIRHAVETAISDGTDWDLELPFIRADGARLWVRCMGKPVWEQGQFVRLMGVFQDITARVAAREALQQTRERMTMATDSCEIGIWDWHIPSGTFTCNSWMYRIYGLEPRDMIEPYDVWRQLVHTEDLAATETLLNDALHGTRPYECVFRVIRPDGQIRHVRATGSVKRDAAGQAVRMVGTNLDITESHRLQTELTTQHEMLRVTLQSIGDGVITTDAQGRAIWLNPVAERMTGWSTAEAAGRDLAEVFHIVNEHTNERAENPVMHCLTHDKVTGLAENTSLISRNGEVFGIEDSAAPIRNENGEILGAVLVFHDVTAQRQISGEMSYRATHDALTGLLNRAEFDVRLRFVLHESQSDRSQSALLFIDLDQFKLVNDTCGHAAGDQLLQQFAKLVCDIVRASDTVARLGGDEFAIILDHCTAAQAQPVAQKICDRLDDYRFLHDGQRFRIGASIGLVPVDQRWSNVTSIIQAADSACYAAKQGGRNRVHMWFDSDETMQARHGETQWATRLADALDENRFELFAQRIHALHDAAPGIHAEILLRMRDEDGTLTQPGAFLPAAERFHMASQIDRWVLRKTVDWMFSVKSLEAIGIICVNLSGQSVGDRAFHRWAMAMLADAGPDICQRLCLEITETAAVTNLADAGVFIEQVRAMGVRVALDDFGAGASSFGYLKSMPVDFLKIDGQFVTDLVTDSLDEAAVRCFADVASVVGMQTVAEFVDHPEVLAKLRSMGIDFAQGFMLHRPEPIAELLVWP
jgi:diguanylate cyclase (GGDEF)-like protein/PAS domain S-box-containing protein